MRIVVLFNLKPGIDAAAYEEWARTREMPGMGSLVSVLDFQIYRAAGLLDSEGTPAYRYIGIIDVNDMKAFDRDISSEAVRKLTAELRDYADDPQFIHTETLGEILS